MGRIEEEGKKALCRQYRQYLARAIITALAEADDLAKFADGIEIMVESLLVAGSFTDKEKALFQVAYKGVQAFKERGQFEKLARFFKRNGTHNWIEEILAWLCNPDPFVQTQSEFIIRVFESGQDKPVREFMQKNGLTFEDFAAVVREVD
jgi:hypothetical protein